MVMNAKQTKPTGLRMLLVRLEGLGGADSTPAETPAAGAPSASTPGEEVLGLEYLYDQRWLTPAAVVMLLLTSRSTNAMVRQASLSPVPSRVTVNAEWVLNPAGNPSYKLAEVWRKLTALQTAHPTEELVLTRIPLHSFHVTQWQLCGALENCTALTRLDLSDSELFWVSAYGEETHMPRWLYILGRLILNLTGLTHLSLARTMMRDEQAVRLAGMLQFGASLVHLDLRGNGHHGGFNYQTVLALREAWNGPEEGLLVEYRPRYNENKTGPRHRMDYTDDEIRRAFEEVPPRELYSDDGEARLSHPRWSDMTSDSEDEEAGVDPDARRTSASDAWTVVVPRNPHPANGRPHNPHRANRRAERAATATRERGGAATRSSRADDYEPFPDDYEPFHEWVSDWDEPAVLDVSDATDDSEPFQEPFDYDYGPLQVQPTMTNHFVQWRNENLHPDEDNALAYGDMFAAGLVTRRPLQDVTWAHEQHREHLADVPPEGAWRAESSAQAAGELARTGGPQHRRGHTSTRTLPR